MALLVPEPSGFAQVIRRDSLEGDTATFKTTARAPMADAAARRSTVHAAEQRATQLSKEGGLVCTLYL